VTTNNAVNVGLSGAIGTGSFAGTTSPTFVTPTLGAASATSIQFSTNNAIKDLNSNAILYLNAVASAVNYVVVSNNVTTQYPYLIAAGSDTDIYLFLEGKGKGGVAVQGTGTNDSAQAGYVGEMKSSAILNANAVSFSTGVAKDLTMITITAGDWDVWGNITFTGTTIIEAVGWVSTTSATVPDQSLYTIIFPLATSALCGFPVPSLRFTATGNTTVYISGYVTGTGSLAACGGIYARRRR
jgi:hypothetical protein